jgi:uncharacterized protein YbjT (DUF2867 family)
MRIEQLKLLIWNYNKVGTVVDALNEVDRVFLVTIPTPNMTEISSSLIKEAKKKAVKHIVKLSVLGADSEPGITIGRLHRLEEKIIEDSGIPYTFLRSSAFMQGFVNYFGQTIKTQNAFYFPAGDGKVSFVDVRDIAVVATQILLTKTNGIRSQQQHRNKTYEITGNEAISYIQAAEILSDNLGRRISYVNIPEEDARKAMKQTGMEDWLVEAVMEYCNVIRAGYTSQTTNVVEEITERHPISFEQFVRDYASSFN